MMPAIQDYGAEPIRKDLGLMLLIASLCPFGFVIWFGLFLGIHWFVSAAWAVAVAVAAG